MRLDVRTGWMAAVLVAWAVLAQGAASRSVSTVAALGSERVIEDPYSGRRWVLTKDPEHPGGPGRLEQMPTGGAAKSAGAQSAAPVIRGGDRVLVEENTRVARALFEAVALSAAKQGATIRVRLSVGGRVVRAVAKGPGRAVLIGSDGVRR